MEPLGSRSSARIQAARDRKEEERKESAVSDTGVTKYERRRRR